MSVAERPKRILAVDHEEQMRRVLRAILASEGYRVSLASTAEEALTNAIDVPPDVVVLDLVLPDRTGVEVCRELRSWMTAPILVISAESDETDAIRALDEGADGYLAKPFSAGELLARIRALLRRSVFTLSQVVAVGELSIDIVHRQVTMAGAEVDLTPTEFDILALLARNADLVVTKKRVLEYVWGPWAGDADTLRVHMSRLRKKLEPFPTAPRYLVTGPCEQGDEHYREGAVSTCRSVSR